MDHSILVIERFPIDGGMHHRDVFIRQANGLGKKVKKVDPGTKLKLPLFFDSDIKPELYERDEVGRPKKD